MIIKDQNYSGQIPKMEPGTEFVNCNFTQPAPHTLLTADPSILFTACNLVNCDLPNTPDGNIIDCLHIHKEIETEAEPAQDVQAQAAQILSQIKPLAYADPLAVKQTIEQTFTPEEFAGVMGAE